MPRRVLRCRIDPQSETPFTREFDLDPLAYCLAHRQTMVAAALTLVRGWLSSGSPRAPGRTASFELWDDYVRQTVVWCIRALGFEGTDPLEGISAAATADPEQEAWHEVLSAWMEVFGDKAVTARAVLDMCTASFADSRLARALAEFNHGRDHLSAKSLGRMLMYRKDRVVSGMRLRQMHNKNRDGVALWCVDAGLAGLEGFVIPYVRLDVASQYTWGKSKPSNASNPAGGDSAVIRDVAI